MTHQKLAYEVGVGLVRAAVVDDEGVDAQDAEDAMNLFVRKVVSESTRLPQEVDEQGRKVEPFDPNAPQIRVSLRSTARIL